MFIHIIFSKFCFKLCVRKTSKDLSESRIQNPIYFWIEQENKVNISLTWADIRQWIRVLELQ